MADTTIVSQGEQSPVREETRSTERYLRPAVDIIETEDGLVLMADLPGATKEKLEIGIDKGILTIRADSEAMERPNEMYREFPVLSYYRQFQLPDVINQERAEADFTNGVLTLKLHKAEAAKPRRIEIKAS